MNIVFMGTPEFAVPTLRALNENHNVMAVFTQPDRPKGRGKKLAASAVKEYATDNNIKVYQPEKLKNDKEIISELKNMNPDFIIVVAYGQILSKEVLDIPKYACINLHASLLPRYRGAAPINWCIINGEKYSGNTTMLMDVGLDTGDMLLTSKYEISGEMTAGELYDILMEDGGELILQTIKGMTEGTIIPQKQDDDKTCYASMLDKTLAKIDWNKSAVEVNNLIRGLNPWPIAHTSYADKNMKIFKAAVIDKDSKEAPGTIINVSNEGIEVAASKGSLLIKALQFPNGKPLKVEEFIKGNKIEKGIILK